MTRVVSFDGDDTLWDFPRVLRAALERTHVELRRRVGPAAAAIELEDLMRAREHVEAENADLGLGLRELRRRSFERLLGGLEGAPLEHADPLTEHFFEQRSAAIELYDDVLPVLDELARSCTLGLLSNGNADTERTPLAGRFAFRVHAEHHGVAKPDPRIFEIACAAAGCGPHELVHVGDALEYDVAGARAAGVRAVWLNRGRVRNDTGIEPDHEIAGLRELPALLLALRGGAAPGAQGGRAPSA